MKQLFSIHLVSTVLFSCSKDERYFDKTISVVYHWFSYTFDTTKKEPLFTAVYKKIVSDFMV
ncbi:hypothetical protein ACFCT7_00505 [Fulvivirgaceae bacterium LMO-SS25]